MPLYPVRVHMDVVVVADDPVDADAIITRQLMRDVISDANDGSFMRFVGAEIKTEEQLKSLHDWDGMCIPYGDSDGNTRIKEYLDGTHLPKSA